MRKLFLLVGILVAAMGITAACTPVELQELQGILKNVDSLSGNVTVTLKDGTTKSFNFSDVKVDTVAQTLGAASLEVGDRVTIKADKTGHVEKVESRNAEAHGTIKSVGNSSLTITTKNNTDISLSITANTTIRIGEKQSANLSQLAVGQKVEVKYEVGTNTAIRINVNVGDTVAEVHGTIASIDTDGKTVTIAAKAANITLNVTPNTTIRIGDKGVATITDLKAGQKVEVKYRTVDNTALRINVAVGETLGEVSGTIKAVDNTTQTITVAGKRGDVTLNITSTTVIRIKDKGTATISDLKVGQKVEAKYSITSKVAIKINAAPVKSEEDKKEHD